MWGTSISYEFYVICMFSYNPLHYSVSYNNTDCIQKTLCIDVIAPPCGGQTHCFVRTCDLRQHATGTFLTTAWSTRNHIDPQARAPWYYDIICIRSIHSADVYHKAHLHWQKPKSNKPGFFVVPFTLPEKPITFGVFGTKSACAKKPESHTGFLVSGARLLSTFDCA